VPEALNDGVPEALNDGVPEALNTVECRRH